ncbi:MAG TPA: TonB-dependent receptor [Pyrinomonadaceae bacterium]|jgi:hypothetical protein|nr:TonB-dependent receptor [Pyrinomonadaceae bacterium]
MKFAGSFRKFYPHTLLLSAVCAIAFLLTASSSAAAQGTIKGKVVADIPDQRKALSGVVVSLTGERLSGKKLQSVSDDEGRYGFPNLIAGEYQVSVELSGFKKYDLKISVQIDAMIEQDLMLRPETVSATVTVRQDPTDAAKTDTTAPSVITGAALQDAPLIDQKFQDALPLLPGVVRGPDGTLNIKGTRPGQSGILVSSLNVTDPVTGNPAIELPLEAVETINVYSNPYSAEYGKFTGAVTAIETRSGTNKLRYLFTGTLPRPRLRDGHIYGIGAATPRIAVGGAIKKDKLFFFQSLEYRFVRTNVPSLDDLNVPSDIKRESFDSFSRLDYVINPANRLTVSFSLFPQKIDYFNLNTFNPIETTANFHERGWFVALNEQAAFKSGALLQSSLSAKKYDGDIFGNSASPYRIAPGRNFGGWYDRQHRDSRRYELLEIYSFAPQKWHGTHSLKTGFNYSHTSFEGTDISRPVTILRANGTRYQLIDFAGGGVLAQKQNEYSAFIQDKWEVNGRVTFDAGLRFDRDEIGRQNKFAPRLGFVFLPTQSGRTVVRGGVGLFFDKIPLNIGSFTQYPSQRVTTFAANGVTVIGGPTLFRNTAPTEFQNPYSVAGNIQVDHQFTERLLLRLGYEERHTRRDFIVEPLAPANQLLLQNAGRSLYREFQVVTRFRFQEGRNIFLSYVRSQARGDLNDYNTYFGNLRNAVIRPNEYGRQNFDVPNRLLFWGDFALPHQIVISPVVEYRNGFPYSAVNEQQDFVSARNAAGRYPHLLTLDVLVMKGVAIPFKGKKYHGRVGITFFNVTNHFNPRDVQNNITSPQFGGFYNSPGISARLKFEFVKY